MIQLLRLKCAARCNEECIHLLSYTRESDFALVAMQKCDPRSSSRSIVFNLRTRVREKGRERMCVWKGGSYMSLDDVTAAKIGCPIFSEKQNTDIKYININIRWRTCNYTHDYTLENDSIYLVRITYARTSVQKTINKSVRGRKNAILCIRTEYL